MTSKSKTISEPSGMPDGSEIVLLFDVIGTAGDVSSLTFDQTSSAVTSFSDTAPTLEFIDGTLSVKIGGYPKLELVGEAELTIEACFDGQFSLTH